MKMDEQNKDAMVLMSECLAEISDLDGAIQFLEAALKIDPSNRSMARDLKELKERWRPKQAEEINLLSHAHRL